MNNSVLNLSSEMVSLHLDATLVLIKNRSLLVKVLGIDAEKGGHKNLEFKVRDSLQTIVGGRREVRTPFGNIDLLTETTLYEVKKLSEWKGAIGQALMYSVEYPRHKLVVYLFDKALPKNWIDMCNAAGKYNVTLLFEEFNFADVERLVVKPIPTRDELLMAMNILSPYCSNTIIDTIYRQIEETFLDALTEDELKQVQEAQVLAMEEIEQNNLRGNANCEQACSKASRIVAGAIIQGKRK